MQGYIYYCSKCGMMGSAYQDDPNDYQKCSVCGAAMHYGGVTKDEWDSKTQEEKEKLREEFMQQIIGSSNSLEEKMDKNLESNLMIMRLLKKQSDDIDIIKNIMVAFLVLAVIVTFIWVGYSHLF